MTISDTQLVERPATSRRRSILTLAGAVDHLLRMEEINPAETRSVERAVAACQSALGSFVSYSLQGFRYYESREKLVMPGTTDIAPIVATSGVVTTDVSLPSWAAMGHLKVGDHSYPVLSSGVGTFTVGTELVDGTYTTASLERVFYPLPLDFRRRGTLADRSDTYQLQDLRGDALQSIEDCYQWVSTAGANRSFAAITADPRYQGALMMAIWPPYASRTELSLFYERYPAPAEVHRVGGVGMSVSGTTATASSGVFTSDHVGAVLAIGTDNSVEFAKSLSSTSLLAAQRVIVGYTSATVVTLDAAISGDPSTRAFYISDVIDVMQGSMRDAYLRLAEYEIMRQSNSKSAPRKYQEFLAQMHVAMADDARYRDHGDGHGSFAGGSHIGTVTGKPD